MENYAIYLNTVFLIILFFYQRNRNKTLAERIKEQSNLLKEAKDVVTQQAQAIDSQKQVVDTALTYSQAFDSKKLEELIRKKADLEYKEIIQEKDNEINDQEKNISKKINEASKYISKLIIAPIFIELIKLLAFEDQKVRDETISKIPEDFRHVAKEALKKADEARRKALCDLLAQESTEK